MKQIKLTNGKFSLVDDDDYDRLSVNTYKKRFPALRKQLKEIGMTYAELAYRTGRSDPWVKNVFRGKTDPRISEACRMLRVTGLPVSTFTEVFIDED